MVISRILAGALFHTVADAKITPWKIGGSGLDWAQSDALAILVDNGAGGGGLEYERPPDAVDRDGRTFSPSIADRRSSRVAPE